MAEEFNLWVSGCSHVGTDLKSGGRRSLCQAICQSERGGSEGGPSFKWDIALHLGDFSGSQTSPDDDEGLEVVNQFGCLRDHLREDFYCLAGNHDASGPGEECQWWFRKWVDPEGRNTEFSKVDPSRRPYELEGTWEMYSVRIGNIILLIMSDRNDGGPPVGRGLRGGYPAGAVSAETFNWWRRLVEKNRDGIVISAHHHMLRETTVASGPWEGFEKAEDGTWQSKYHGYFPDGGPKGASYLYFVGGKPDANSFETFLKENPGAVDIWLGGHTHTNPEDRTGGRSHVENKWGATFVNAAALTKYHVGNCSVPMSRLITFVEGSSRATVRCYLHTSQFRKQGWYLPAKRVIELGSPFER